LAYKLRSNSPKEKCDYTCVSLRSAIEEMLEHIVEVADPDIGDDEDLVYRLSKVKKALPYGDYEPRFFVPIIEYYGIDRVYYISQSPGETHEEDSEYPVFDQDPNENDEL
jgi:hypothetical protein